MCRKSVYAKFMHLIVIVARTAARLSLSPEKEALFPLRKPTLLRRLINECSLNLAL